MRWSVRIRTKFTARLWCSSIFLSTRYTHATDLSMLDPALTALDSEWTHRVKLEILALLQLKSAKRSGKVFLREFFLKSIEIGSGCGQNGEKSGKSETAQ